MSNPWFRMYSEFATDPKVQMLSEQMQRRLMMLFCMRCSNNLVTLQEDEIAFQLRISDADLAETKALFISKKFIDKSWNILNWEKRQFASDSSKARVAKHRALQKEKQAAKSNDDVTLQERQSNALEQNRTDTEQIQNIESAARGTLTPGDVCKAMKAHGMQSVNPSNPKLLALINQGMSLAEFEQAAIDSVVITKGFAYALAMAEGRRKDALQPPRPAANTRQPIETFAERDARIGRERWEEMTGRIHPDNLPKVTSPTAFVVDVSTQKLEFQQ